MLAVHWVLEQSVFTEHALPLGQAGHVAPQSMPVSPSSNT